MKMVKMSKYLPYLALPVFLAAMPLVSCVRDAGTTPAETVTLKQTPPTTAVDARLDFLIKILGIAESSISTYVDSVARDTSYVVAPKFSDLIARLASLRKRELRKGAIALRQNVVDTLMSRHEKQRMSAGIDISSQNLLGTTVAANPSTPVTGGTPGGLAKNAHTRWVHWTSLLDVKALTEVRQIKVYIKNSGSDALGPNWQTGVRNAIANWTSQAKGTAISFVETKDIDASDLVIRGAYGLGSDGLMSYLVWLNPGPYVERIPTYGGAGNGTSVDIVLNIGYEHNGVPISEKTKIAMTAMANILNIGWIDTENWYWNFGDFTYIPGTLHSDGDALTPGSSIMTQNSSEVSTPVMTAGDLQLFRTLYPAHAITVKMYNEVLTTVGYEGFTTIASSVKAFQVEGDTLIYSTNDGKLFRRIGLTGNNTQVWPASGSSGSVNSFLHSKGYLAVFTGTRLYTRTPTGSWVKQYGDNFQARNKYRLDGERLFAMTFDAADVPAIYLKYLTFSPSTFTKEYQGSGYQSIADFQSRNGIFAVADNGNVWAKQYGVYGWMQIHSGAANGVAQKISLSDQLLAFYRVPSGSSYGYPTVLVGGLGGVMLYLPDPMNRAEDMDVCGDKFAFLQQGAWLRVTDYGQWVVHEHYTLPTVGPINAVRLSGDNCDHVMVQDHGATIWAKYGATLGTDYFQYQTLGVTLSQRP